LRCAVGCRQRHWAGLLITSHLRLMLWGWAGIPLSFRYHPTDPSAASATELDQCNAAHFGQTWSHRGDSNSFTMRQASNPAWHHAFGKRYESWLSRSTCPGRASRSPARKSQRCSQQTQPHVEAEVAYLRKIPRGRCVSARRHRTARVMEAARSNSGHGAVRRLRRRRPWSQALLSRRRRPASLAALNSPSVLGRVERSREAAWMGAMRFASTPLVMVTTRMCSGSKC